MTIKNCAKRFAQTAAAATDNKGKGPILGFFPSGSRALEQEEKHLSEASQGKSANEEDPQKK